MSQSVGICCIWLSYEYYIQYLLYECKLFAFGSMDTKVKFLSGSEVDFIVRPSGNSS